MKNSLESINQYTAEGLQMIRFGEVGRYEDTRFIEQNNVPKGNANNTSNDPYDGVSTPWTNGASSWMFYFGADTVTEAICIPEEIRAKLPGDYGRSKGIAWYALGGFGIIHSAPTNARIIMWDAAS